MIDFYFGNFKFHLGPHEGQKTRFFREMSIFLEKAHSFIRKTQLFKQSNRAAKTCFFQIFHIFCVLFEKKKRVDEV